VGTEPEPLSTAAVVVTVADLPRASTNDPDAPPTFPPARVVIAALEAGAPFSVTCEENRTSVRTIFTRCFLPLIRFVVYVVSFLRVTVVRSRTSTWRKDCTSTVPATFAVPLPGLYGVQRDVQRRSPAALGSVIADDVNVAERNFAPNAERPGVPAGTSGGGRQTTSFAE
jgi:hypothetical protein